MANITKFLKGVRGEISYIAWPTRNEVIAYTAIVIVVSLLVAAYTGALDYIIINFFEPLFVS